MKLMNVSWRVTLAQVLLCSAILFALVVMHGDRAAGSGNNPVHLVTDWSHRHVVFSRPRSIWQASQLQKEPRYWHQYFQQNAWALRPAFSKANSSAKLRDPDHDGDVDGPGPDRDALFHRDWAIDLGSGARGLAGQFPAKFVFDITAPPDCTADYVAMTTRRSQLAIVAFDNLYSTQPGAGGFCGTAGPSVKWAYDTRVAGDASGTTALSPTLSIDGTKVLYVETRTAGNGGAILQILKWKPGAGTAIQGTIAAPAVPDTVLGAGANWSTCPAANSCVASLVFSGGQPDSNSAPFYSYGADVAYVGDDAGVLHKFTGVFNGTPTEVTAAPWPMTVDAGGRLTGPVFDSGSGNIYVGDSKGVLSYVMDAGSTTGNCVSGTPPCLGSPNQSLGGSIVDPPVVDSTTGFLLVFDGTDVNNGSVYQFDTFLNANPVNPLSIGGNGPGSSLHAGTFDNAYFTAGPGLGHFYTCGKDPAVRDNPAIFQLFFDGTGALSGAASPLTNLVSSASSCSSVSEVLNGATDHLFFSVAVSARPPASGGNATGCTATFGCVMSITVPATWPPSATTAGALALGGTSGIVIDNVGSGAQESNIYFLWLSNTTVAHPCNGGLTGDGCGVKLTQSGLN